MIWQLQEMRGFHINFSFINLAHIWLQVISFWEGPYRFIWFGAFSPHDSTLFCEGSLRLFGPYLTLPNTLSLSNSQGNFVELITYSWVGIGTIYISENNIGFRNSHLGYSLEWITTIYILNYCKSQPNIVDIVLFWRLRVKIFLFVCFLIIFIVFVCTWCCYKISKINLTVPCFVLP